MTLLLQALAGTLTVWCTMRTASLLFRGDEGDDSAPTPNPASVTACGWLAACEPLALLCGALMMADALLAAAVSVAVLLLVMHFREPSTRTALGARRGARRGGVHQADRVLPARGPDPVALVRAAPHAGRDPPAATYATC